MLKVLLSNQLLPIFCIALKQHDTNNLGSQESLIQYDIAFKRPFTKRSQLDCLSSGVRLAFSIRFTDSCVLKWPFRNASNCCDSIPAVSFSCLQFDQMFYSNFPVLI